MNLPRIRSLQCRRYLGAFLRFTVTFGLLATPAALPTARAISSAPAAPEPEARPITALYHFRTTVPVAPVGAKFVDVWIPIPSDGPYQTIDGVFVSATVPYQMTTEPKYGNRMVYLHVPSNRTPTMIDVSFVAKRRPVQILTLKSDGALPVLPDKAATASLPSAKELLLRDKRAPVGGRFTPITKGIVGDLTSVRSEMRALYDNVVSTTQYDYQHESPVMGEGDAAFTSTFKKGDGTDLNSYLTTLARSAGIPTYMEFGYSIAPGIPVSESLPSEGAIPGFHSWVWFQDQEIGWLPVDAGDARLGRDVKRPDLEGFLFGDLLTERASLAVSRGRDLRLDPPQQADPLNFFARAYAEADGTPMPVEWSVQYALPQSPQTPSVPATKTTPAKEKTN